MPPAVRTVNGGSSRSARMRSVDESGHDDLLKGLLQVGGRVQGRRLVDVDIWWKSQQAVLVFKQSSISEKANTQAHC